MRHALLALSALHEIRNIDGHHEFSNLEAQQNGFALRQYSKYSIPSIVVDLRSI